METREVVGLEELRAVCVEHQVKVFEIAHDGIKSIVYFEDVKVLLIFRNHTAEQIKSFISLISYIGKEGMHAS